MFTKGIKLENFTNKKKLSKIKLSLKDTLRENNEIIKSLQSNYKYSFSKKIISKIKKYNDICIIGMGGSILGTRSIYNFLGKKIKKNFSFIDNIKKDKLLSTNNKKKLNLIVSKSGNTLETLSNANIVIKKNDHNIFVTENKNSYLTTLAKKLKADIVDHNNFIGGRYSVLSEVGMLPAELMGLKTTKFKRLNNLVKNKNFLNSLK